MSYKLKKGVLITTLVVKTPFYFHFDLLLSQLLFSEAGSSS